MTVEVDEDEGVDFAFAAWREEGRWQVARLADRATASVSDLIAALRQLPGEGGTLGFVAVADEFFLMMRVLRDGSARTFVSDLNAAYDWSLAEEAAELAGVEVPEDDDELDEPEPAGDFEILTDFGFDAAELDVLCSDDELFPDEQVTSIAGRLGFGDLVEALLDEGVL